MAPPVVGFATASQPSDGIKAMAERIADHWPAWIAFRAG